MGAAKPGFSGISRASNIFARPWRSGELGAVCSRISSARSKESCWSSSVGARPDRTPASPLANGGAFGGKRRSPVPGPRQAFATRGGEVVRVLSRREDVVRRGPKRPPLGLGLRPDGSGLVRVGRTPGSADLAPLVDTVEERAAPVLESN